ncbi:hypothetical protein EPUL_006260 [Erysiphe pulchra]|uniref:Uncharacterized protein n=1 Tax=Erysiphe pulchra TaxID=225359 RepID=A0A2S4PLU7_9PEZI|nr:hypothetical protein EPUL_006260 [Erysiphe pulchra]
MRAILPISSLLHSTVLFQLSGALPIQDFFYSSASTPDNNEESSLSSISTFVSDFLSTHKVTIPQPNFEFFSLINDYSSSTYEEALETLNSMLDFIPYSYSSQELDSILNQEEEILEFEYSDSDFQKEPELSIYSPGWEDCSQSQGAVPEKKQEANIIGHTILLSELKGRGDIVVVGIVLLFLITCFTLEMSKRWNQHRKNLKNYRQNGAHLVKENMSDSFNEKKYLSSIEALPLYNSVDEKKLSTGLQIQSNHDQKELKMALEETSNDSLPQ